MIDKPLEWINKSLDAYEFHKKQIKEFGQTEAGRPWHGKRGWSIGRTAKQLKISYVEAWRRVKLGEAIKNKTIPYAQFNSMQTACAYLVRQNKRNG